MTTPTEQSIRKACEEARLSFKAGTHILREIERGLTSPVHRAILALARRIAAEREAVVDTHPVTLNDCPPGLFWFEDMLGFKSEYTTTLENPRRYQCDAYVVESGEYFHGGAKSTEERGKLLVRPVSADPPKEPTT